MKVLKTPSFLKLVNFKLNKNKSNVKGCGVMNKLIYVLPFIVLVIIFFSFKSNFAETVKIPQTVHKIFIDSKMEPGPIDDKIQQAMDTWKRPGYIVKLWYGQDCRKYLLDNFGKEHLECFDNIIPYAFKADFMRYCIIYNEGGWYSDWQQVLLEPLDQFEKYSWVSCWDTTGEENKINGCMQNGFFGSVKNSPILKDAIAQVIENCKQNNFGKSPWYPTGPCLLGDSFRKSSSKLNVKLGFTENDPKLGPCFIIDSKKIIINKCCSDINVPATNFRHGNNYIELWKQKNVFKVGS
jgi:mannosyltransferase OCH1-like enzyme